MRFEIAKPENNMSLGSLFYTLAMNPDGITEFNDIVAQCIDIANNELDSFAKELLLKEIEEIEDNGYQMLICIAKTIIDISHRMGYPCMFYGTEAGTIIMQILLGKKNIQAYQYSTDWFIDKMTKFDFCITLAIAEPVRVYIQRELNEKYSNIKSDDENYHRMSLPQNTNLKLIKELADKTGVSYTEIDPFKEKIIKALYEERHTILFGTNQELPKEINLEELYRLFGFNVCHTDNNKSFAFFNEVKDYIFRDDFYDVFMYSKMRARDALYYSYMGMWDKDKSISDLEKYNIISEYKRPYYELENVWSKASCASRIDIELILMWYKIHFPNEYNEIVK